MEGKTRAAPSYGLAGRPVFAILKLHLRHFFFREILDLKKIRLGESAYSGDNRVGKRLDRSVQPVHFIIIILPGKGNLVFG